MALTADQQAALQLLLEREQSYDALAELLGVSEADVRERARSALRELAGADPDRTVALTDYLLGQADPIGRADVVRHLREDAEDRRLAGELVERLRESFPAAELPRLPGEPRRGGLRRRTARDREPTVRRRPSIAERLPEGRSRLWVAIGSGAVLLIAIVLGVTGAFGGGDGADDTAASTTSTTSAADTTEGEEVPLPLRPVGNSDAAGVVTFGFASADQPFVDIQLRNLQPPTNEEAYVMWFLTSQDSGYPLPTALEVDAQGRYGDRLAVPAAVFSVVQQAESVVIALINRRDLARDITGAIQGGGQGTLPFPGGTVLEAPLRGAPAGG